MDDSDEALMARVARGDEAAFRELSRRHVPAMLALARRILGILPTPRMSPRKPCCASGPNAPRWRPLAAVRTWITRVVVNLCLDRKRRAPWVALEAAGEIADPSPGAEHGIESSQLDRQVAAAVAKLPARQRTAVALTYNEGMSNAQVAEILDTSVSAVETLLVRAHRAYGKRSVI